ncbi:MAG: uracil-DNA glycosylase [Bacteroidales bacterium]|nr:uracil-DNA glycosylase [Bacteroidales bacterium]MBN2633336.1 uracil-DNA glycosylase [Bacteroidales bacterium]
MQSANDEFEDLRTSVLSCRKCELANTRNNVIFGEGNTEAGILIIGEAPGKDEDIVGRPFVGKSGQLLDKILAACGFTREKHVFISNIVKCRPPENRVPTPHEAAICMPWLLKQIDLINPRILILLGATALKYMAGNDYKIRADHGKWIILNNRLAVPVYHPAALLRDPGLKRPTWEDFKKIVLKYRELVDPDHYSAHV